jgi:hypothetical protein
MQKNGYLLQSREGFFVQQRGHVKQALLAVFKRESQAVVRQVFNRSDVEEVLLGTRLRAECGVNIRPVQRSR